MAKLHYQIQSCDSVAYLMSDHLSNGLLLPYAQTVFDASGQRVKVADSWSHPDGCVHIRYAIISAIGCFVGWKTAYVWLFSVLILRSTLCQNLHILATLPARHCHMIWPRSVAGPWWIIVIIYAWRVQHDQLYIEMKDGWIHHPVSGVSPYNILFPIQIFTTSAS